MNTIYISSVNPNYTDDTIRTYMYTNNIGIVDSVDFIVPGQKPGFFEPEPNPQFKSAFVHFRHHNKQHPLWTRVSSGNKYVLSVVSGSHAECWICSNAHHPVPRTQMNVHQVVSNCRHLELLVAQQASTIQTQAATISALDTTVRGIQSVVRQLLGGLFDQETQAGVLNTHLKVLSQDHAIDIDPHTNVNPWPTTRQGDELQRRISLLEHQLDSFRQRVHFYDDYIEDDDDNHSNPYPTTTNSHVASPYYSPIVTDFEHAFVNPVVREPITLPLDAASVLALDSHDSVVREPITLPL